MGEKFTLFKKIWNIVAWVLVIVVLLGAAAVSLPGVFGISVMKVDSDSMGALNNPTLKENPDLLKGHVGQFAKGALIYVDTNADISEVEQYDVVTQQISADLRLTHRVVEVNKDENGKIYLKTHGDTNEDPDEGKVVSENFVGKVVLAVPFAGYFMQTIQGNPILAVLGAIILLILLFVPDIVSAVVVLWKGEEAGQAASAEEGSVPSTDGAASADSTPEENDKDGE